MLSGLLSWRGGRGDGGQAALASAPAVRARNAVDPLRPARSSMMTWDKPLLFVCLGLLMFGMVMVYSASIALPGGWKVPKSQTYFLVRQAMFATIGITAGALAFRIPLATWQRWSPYLFVFTCVLLVAVLIPGVGKGETKGARRWIALYFFNFQPSEMMKLMVALYAADYTARKQAWMHQFRKGFLPMATVVVLVGALLQLEPDLGAFIVIASVALGILFLGGVNTTMFLALGAAMVSGFVLLIWITPWRLARIFAYLDPFNQENAAGKAYQLSHSLMAFGRGEWFGVGLGASVEKLFYLPEAHNDFLLAVIGEELGLVGVAVVIAAFFWVVQRAFEIGRQAIALERTYAGLVAKGIGIWIGVQSFINMGVNLGLLPTKGLTLPLMSYGGSSVVVTCFALSLLLRIDYENRVLMRGGRV